jgi:hypothetical protein
MNTLEIKTTSVVENYTKQAIKRESLIEKYKATR